MLTWNHLNVSAWYKTASSQGKTSLVAVIPTATRPHIPSPCRLGQTLMPPPPSPAAPAAPPCAASPLEPCCPLIWSDTATYSRLRSSQRRLSYPRVPVVRSPLSLCSSGSVTIEPSLAGAPLRCMLNPQRSHRGSQHAHRLDCWVFGGAQEEGFQLWGRQRNRTSNCQPSLCVSKTQIQRKGNKCQIITERCAV